MDQNPRISTKRFEPIIKPVEMTNCDSNQFEELTEGMTTKNSR